MYSLSTTSETYAPLRRKETELTETKCWDIKWHRTGGWYMITSSVMYSDTLHILPLEILNPGGCCSTYGAHVRWTQLSG